MTVKINLHVTHRVHANGLETVESEGTTIGEALNYFVSLYPAMKTKIFDKKGELFHYIEIYLNNKSAYPGELEKPIKDGDEIQILTFLAGG